MFQFIVSHLAHVVILRFTRMFATYWRKSTHKNASQSTNQSPHCFESPTYQPHSTPTAMLLNCNATAANAARAAAAASRSMRACHRESPQCIAGASRHCGGSAALSHASYLCGGQIKHKTSINFHVLCAPVRAHSELCALAIVRAWARNQPSRARASALALLICSTHARTEAHMLSARSAVLCVYTHTIKCKCAHPRKHTHKPINKLNRTHFGARSECYPDPASDINRRILNSYWNELNRTHRRDAVALSRLPLKRIGSPNTRARSHYLRRAAPPASHASTVHWRRERESSTPQDDDGDGNNVQRPSECRMPGAHAWALRR